MSDEPDRVIRHEEVRDAVLEELDQYRELRDLPNWRDVGRPAIAAGIAVRTCAFFIDLCLTEIDLIRSGNVLTPIEQQASIKAIENVIARITARV